MFFVQMCNEIDQSIIIDRHSKLEDVIEYDQDNCYLVDLDCANLTIDDWNTSKWKHKTFANFVDFVTTWFANTSTSKATNDNIANSCDTTIFIITTLISLFEHSIRFELYEIESFLMSSFIKHIMHNNINVYEESLIVLIFVMIANIYLII